MLKSALAIVAGLIAGVAIVFVSEAIGHMLYPPPDGVDLKDPDQLKTIMQEIPLGAKLAVLVAWGLGTFGGGVTAIMVSGRKAWPAGIVALILLAGAGATLLMIPHPIWMMVATPIISGLAWFAATRLAHPTA